MCRRSPLPFILQNRAVDRSARATTCFIPQKSRLANVGSLIGDFLCGCSQANFIRGAPQQYSFPRDPLCRPLWRYIIVLY